MFEEKEQVPTPAREGARVLAGKSANLSPQSAVWLETQEKCGRMRRRETRDSRQKDFIKQCEVERKQRNNRLGDGARVEELLNKKDGTSCGYYTSQIHSRA